MSHLLSYSLIKEAMDSSSSSFKLKVDKKYICNKRSTIFIVASEGFEFY